MSNINSTVCRADIPYPSVSNESVPSLIANLVQALYGEISKTVVDGRVVWNIPCDPENSASVPQLPREPGEGLMCYLIRLANSGTYTPVYPGAGIVTFNIPGNYSWTPPLFVPRVKITLVGAGGGGGGVSATNTGTLATAGGDTTCVMGGYTTTAGGGHRGSYLTNRYVTGNLGYDPTAGNGGDAFSTDPFASFGSGGSSPVSSIIYIGADGGGINGYYGGGGASRCVGGGAGLFGGGGGGSYTYSSNGGGGRGYMYGGFGAEYSSTSNSLFWKNAKFGGGGGSYNTTYLGGGGGAYVLLNKPLPLTPSPILFTVGAAGINGTNGSASAGDGVVVIEY